MLIIPDTLRKNEVIADLLDGLYKRLSRAAWNAKNHCEDITKDKAKNGYDAILFTRTQLDEAARILTAIRDLEAQQRPVTPGSEE